MIHKLLTTPHRTALSRLALRFSFTSQNPEPEPTHYEVLRLPFSATPAQIKKRYYELSKVFHPDMSSEQQKKYHHIKQAYETLISEQLRKQYDEQIKASMQTDAKAGKQERHSKTGPYGDEEQYRKYTEQNFYSTSRYEWYRMQVGYWPGSYISRESALNVIKGAQFDEDVLHYAYRLNKLKETQSQQQKEEEKQKQPLSEQEIAARMKQIQQNHRKKLEQIIRQAQRNKIQELRKTFLGRAYLKIRQVLGRSSTSEQ